MAPRVMASGTVTVGLVTVPVRIFSAAESVGGVSFNLLHAGCGSRLKQQYVCQKDSEVVTRDAMVKGHEFAKDQYVTFTEDEMKALAEASSTAIEISVFVPLAKIDPLFYDSGAYFLGPDKGGDRAYALLAAALRKTKQCAIARWVSRGRGHLVAIRAGAAGKGLVMQVLRYADEVRSIDELPLGDGDVSDAELKLALLLVKQISEAEFRPDAFVDEVRERIQDAVAKKVKGEKVVAAPAEGAPGPTPDLMAALKATLAKKRPAAARARRAA